VSPKQQKPPKLRGKVTARRSLPKSIDKLTTTGCGHYQKHIISIGKHSANLNKGLLDGTGIINIDLTTDRLMELFKANKR
jgi:hypothetical protein